MPWMGDMHNGIRHSPSQHAHSPAGSVRDVHHDGFEPAEGSSARHLEDHIRSLTVSLREIPAQHDRLSEQLRRPDLSEDQRDDIHSEVDALGRREIQLRDELDRSTALRVRVLEREREDALHSRRGSTQGASGASTPSGYGTLSPSTNASQSRNPSPHLRGTRAPPTSRQQSRDPSPFVPQNRRG